CLRAHHGRVIEICVCGFDRPQMIAVANRHPGGVGEVSRQPRHRRSLSDRNQVADEDEGLARRDYLPGAPVTVGQVRGDDQLSAAADLHALYALIPAGDDSPGAELELQGLASVPARIELLAGGVRDPDIVDPYGVSRLRLAAIAFPDVSDLQFGGRFAAGKIDLRPLDVHSRPLLGLLPPELMRPGTWQDRNHSADSFQMQKILKTCSMDAGCRSRWVIGCS